MRALVCTPSITAKRILAAYCPASHQVSAACRAPGSSNDSSTKRKRSLRSFTTVQTHKHCSGITSHLPSSGSGSSSSKPARLVQTAAIAAEGAAMASATQLSANKHFDGYNRRYKHSSSALGCDMTFTVYFPPTADQSHPSPQKVPIIYYLSGLTCTDENVIQKSGVQRACAEHGIAFIAPDTSPRGLNVDGEADSWDFGVGAGFYVNSTVDKWKNWRMYDYITKELPGVLQANFPTLDTSNASIMGHSMGGHGALTIALKNPGVYKSLSAFAPICNPCTVPWGIKAFTGYFGEDNKELWAAHDATELVKKYQGPSLPTLVDTGSGDNNLEVQLKPEVFEAAAKEAGFPVTMRLQDGYDHSYYTIATFICEHVDFHAKALKP